MNDHDENAEIFELNGGWIITLFKVLLMLLVGAVPIAYLTYLSIIR